MHLTIDELLAYTDEERGKWEDWFTAHGNEPLKFALAMDLVFSKSFGPLVHKIQ